jgi:tetratricopeptide (TPR) repeat protein
MPGQSTRWNCKNVLWILLILFTATRASAEWYKDYENALNSIKKGRWSDAIPRLQSAISQRNEEGLNIKFYGMKFDDYLPHFYLGKAYFSQNNYQAALHEFEISLSQGEIQRSQDLFQNLKELQTLAKAQLSPAAMQPPQEKTQPVVQEPESVPVTPEAKTTTPAEIKSEPQVAVRMNPEPPKQSPQAAPKEAPPPAPELTPSPEELNREKTKSLVKEGAKSYFQGDFDQAIASFSSALKVSPQEFSAQFLLGCSYAAKYLLSGSSDKTAYEKAETAFQQSRKINPNHPLTKSNLISPAVRQLYEKSAGA